MKFPIFLRDRDNWMYMFCSLEEYRSHVEAIDITDKEYDAWDSQGTPLSLFLADGKPALRETELQPDPAALANAIVRYASLAGKKAFALPTSGQSPSALFELAEQHIATCRPTLRKRMKKWFGKS